MKKSIIPGSDPETCYLCSRNGVGDPLEKHHIFGGANRKYSEQDGLFVWLCGNRCHRNGTLSAHRCADTARTLHEIGQRAWERENGSRDAFMKRYGKNFLEVEHE